jgi:hypothetical protein
MDEMQQAGNAKANKREPKSWLFQVFYFKLGCCYEISEWCKCMSNSKVKNLANVLSSSLKFVHGAWNPNSELIQLIN